MPNQYAPGQRTPQQIAAGYTAGATPAPVTPTNPSGFDPSRLPPGSNPNALTIDQVNIAMRASPVWNSWMQQHHQDVTGVRLSDSDRNGLGRTLELAGFALPDGWEIDQSGNIREQTHKVRNTLIAAAIVGGAFGGAALVAAYGGATAAGAGGAAAAGAGGGTAAGVGAGTLASTAIGTGYIGGIAGGTGLATGLGAAGAVGAGAGIAGGFSTGAGATGITSATGTGLAAGGYGTTAAAGGATAGGAGLAALPTTSIPGSVGGSATVTGGTGAVGLSNAARNGFSAGNTVHATGYGSTLANYGLGYGGDLLSSYIQSRAASGASDAQQKYLEEALAYEKEKDQYQRGVDTEQRAREQQRYGDYQGRIAPFIANGTTSNDRMAALLGLPARSGGGGGGGGSSSSGGSSGPRGVPVSPAITARLEQEYRNLGYTPTGRGTGPTDIGYYADEYAKSGGSNPDNDRYWFGPDGRIAQDAAKAGTQRSTSPTSPASTPTSTFGGPLAVPGSAIAPRAVGGAPVSMRAPDGSVNQVPPDQVAHYTQLGATLLSGTA